MNQRPSETPNGGSPSTEGQEKTAAENSVVWTRFNPVVDLSDQHTVLCSSEGVEVILTNVHGVSDHIRIRSIK